MCSRLPLFAGGPRSARIRRVAVGYARPDLPQIVKVEHAMSGRPDHARLTCAASPVTFEVPREGQWSTPRSPTDLPPRRNR